VNATSGKINDQGNGAATVPTAPRHESLEVGGAVPINRYASASGADGAHVRRTVPGDRDRATMRTDALAMGLPIKHEATLLTCE
jgi:hypothetical protein